MAAAALHVSPSQTRQTRTQWSSPAPLGPGARRRGKSAGLGAAASAQQAKDQFAESPLGWLILRTRVERTKLVSDRECGVKRPSGPSLKLLTLVRLKGLDAIA
jgi:hypothetical protein